MDLQEQVTTLNTEKQQYIKLIEDLNAEKLALDQMLIEALKNTLNLKKEIIGKNTQINDLNTQLQSLLKEKEISNGKIQSISCEKSVATEGFNAEGYPENIVNEACS